VLSGGEKARLVMASMLYDPPNFLVLDEPTNHLDLDTKEMLTRKLAEYEGTMLFVSHDRHFLSQVSTRVLELTAQGKKLLPLVQRVERSVAAVEGFVGTEASTVRLVVPSGFPKLFTPEWAELHAEHPDLSLEFVSGAQPVDLRRGEADLAIRVGVVTEPDLVARKLCESASALYASPAYLKRKPAQRDPEDLRGHELIGFGAALAKIPAARWLEERATGATFVMRSREMVDVLTAAVSGIGVALLPCHLGIRSFGVRVLLQPPAHERGFHAPWATAIHTNPIRCVIQRHAFRQSNHRELGRAIRQPIPNSNHPADRCQIDDISRFTIEHSGQKRFREVKHSTNIHLVKTIQIARRSFQDGSHMSDSCVVYQNIHAGIFLCSILSRLLVHNV
jgi:DNA-binding transcriptional LysR family regulator